MSTSSAPASPPPLLRALTDRPSPKKLSKDQDPCASEDFRSLQSELLHGDDPFDATSSHVSHRMDASTGGGLARSRARSISSNAVPTISSFINSGLAPPIQTSLLHQPDRGPGTPDFTVGGTFGGPSNKRFSPPKERRKAASLASALSGTSAADSQVSTLKYDDPPRNSIDDSSRDEDQGAFVTPTGSKGISEAYPETSRPPFRSQFRSFLSSLTGSSSQGPSTPCETSGTSAGFNFMPKAEEERFQALAPSAARLLRPQPLAMPAARPAGPEGLRGLNADSPPLTPTSDKDEMLEYRDAKHLEPETQYRHHTAPKHQWSAAQAAADASSTERSHGAATPESGAWPFTPPLTLSSASSPVYSARAFSPPVRPESAFSGHYNSILPSHLIPDHGRGSRPTTPTSTESSTSDQATGHAYKAWDVESFSFRTLTKAFISLLPRIQVNFSSWSVSFPPLRPYFPRLLCLLVIFAAATSCIVFMLTTIPLSLPAHLTSLTLTEIKEIALSLKTYAESSPKSRTHTLLVLSALFTWKQSFCIPGSLIMNVVFGAMYGTYWGTFYTSILTSLGGVFCYLLSAPLAPLITSLPGLTKPLDSMRKALSPGRAHAPGSSVVISNSRGSSSGNVWSYLLVLRILPIIPYGVMNIACGVLGVPLVPYAGTLAIGSIPWNFVTCQVGDILQEIVEALPSDEFSGIEGSLGTSDTAKLAAKSAGGGVKAILDRVWNKEMVFKLFLLSLASLLPMLLNRWLKRRRGEGEGYEAVEADDESPELAQTRADEENDRGRGSSRRARVANKRESAQMAEVWGWNRYEEVDSPSEGLRNWRSSHIRENTDEARRSAWI
ncbi:hypothetical protein IE53DRAFT_167122 [Violaceomyces palustris]|uniref:Uncharacterized protein n=1 Tax=Violaceomyces palustris TaxID=1673888 RepID=A0ACD0NT45_9BASI|nr:hypothetical protein IE53DRAFT_167122 [Violaceomyces palustris]